MTEAIGIAVLLPVFALWIALTVRHARPRDARELNVYGIFGLLIPSWNFFAPNPGVHDYYLLYRDYLSSGEAGAWREVTGFSEPRPWLTCVWNPRKLERKALFDLVMALSQELREDPPAEPAPGEFEYLKLTVPYIALTNFILTLPRSPFTSARQFLILRGSKAGECVERLMVSGLHGW